MKTTINLVLILTLIHLFACKKESETKSTEKLVPASYMTFGVKSYQLKNIKEDTSGGAFAIMGDYYYQSNGTTYQGGTTISFKYRNSEPDLGSYYKTNDFFDDTLTINMKVREEDSTHYVNSNLNCITGQIIVSMLEGKRVYKGNNLKFIWGDSGSFVIYKP